MLTPRGRGRSAASSRQLSTRTAVGEVGILATPRADGRSPGAGRAAPPHSRAARRSATPRARAGCEVFANRARVLVAEAIPPDELDAGELRRAPRGGRAAAGARGRRRASGATAARGLAEIAEDGGRARGLLGDRRPRAPRALLLPCRVMEERALTERADRLRHLHRGGHQALRRIRQGLARGARHRGAARSESADLPVHDRRGGARRTRPDACCSTATSTWSPGAPEQFEPRARGRAPASGAAPTT